METVAALEFLSAGLTALFAIHYANRNRVRPRGGYVLTVVSLLALCLGVAANQRPVSRPEPTVPMVAYPTPRMIAGHLQDIRHELRRMNDNLESREAD